MISAAQIAELNFKFEGIVSVCPDCEKQFTDIPWHCSDCDTWAVGIDDWKEIVIARESEE